MLLPEMRIETRDVPPRTAWALEQAGVHPLLARLFAARGVRGAAAAAELLADAIGAGSRICVVADYDCDGATACAVMLRGLRMLGADPSTLGYVVPDRRIHGYGLTPAIVDLALERQAPDVLLTVDNGIASLEGVAHAVAHGLTVVITDHHLPAVVDGRVRLPEADVIVDPSQPDCTFASKQLAGVGVAFYVLLALRAELRERGEFAEGPAAGPLPAPAAPPQGSATEGSAGAPRPPVLHYRGLRHGVVASKYWDMGDDDREYRYNNYIGRYHFRHLDLMDLLALYQPRANAPLDAMAKLCGFPRERGMDGSQVFSAYKEGRTD